MPGTPRSFPAGQVVGHSSGIFLACSLAGAIVALNLRLIRPALRPLLSTERLPDDSWLAILHGGEVDLVRLWSWILSGALVACLTAMVVQFRNQSRGARQITVPGWCLLLILSALSTFLMATNLRLLRSVAGTPGSLLLTAGFLATGLSLERASQDFDRAIEALTSWSSSRASKGDPASVAQAEPSRSRQPGSEPDPEPGGRGAPQPVPPVRVKEKEPFAG